MSPDSLYKRLAQHRVAAAAMFVARAIERIDEGESLIELRNFLAEFIRGIDNRADESIALCACCCDPMGDVNPRTAGEAVMLALGGREVFVCDSCVRRIIKTQRPEIGN
ncbi:MAG: hypothetical protein WBQ34_10255 [Candidatus Acidiferrales bacterium]|jgi:hypothetical protein